MSSSHIHRFRITPAADSATNLDQYCYLLFMKAVITRHLKKPVEALEMFDEVLAW